MDEDLINEINAVTGEDSSEKTPVQPIEVSTPAPEPVTPVVEPVPAPAPAPAKTPDFSKTKKKSGKGFLIAGILLVLLAVGGTVATLFLTGVIGGKGGKADDAAINSVNEKLNIMFGAPASAESISEDNSDFIDVDFFNNGTLPTDKKLWRAFFSLNTEDKETLTESQVAAAKAKLMEIGYVEALVESTDIIAYREEKVKDHYYEIFNENYASEDDAFYPIQYNKEGGYFFAIDFRGFLSSSTRYYRKQKTTVDGDKVSVTVSAAQLDLDTKKVHCGVYGPAEEVIPAVCSSIDEEFTIEKITEDKYATVRFDFTKKDNGSYYLSGFETVYTPNKIAAEPATSIEE